MESVESKKLLVYLIDDDQDFGKFVLQNVVRERRLAVRYFSDFEKMWKALENEVPELILVDLHFGKMKNYGFELASKLKERYADVALWMVSSQSDRQAINHALELGIDDYITKPVNDQYLLAKLLDCYSQRSNSRLQSGVLTGFKVPGAERNIHCRLSYQVSAVHEEGVLVRGPHYISRGATIQIKSPVLNDIFSQDRPYQFIVDDVEADEKEENFFTLRLLLVGPDQKLVGKFREYLRQKNS